MQIVLARKQMSNRFVIVLDTVRGLCQQVILVDLKHTGGLQQPCTVRETAQGKGENLTFQAYSASISSRVRVEVFGRTAKGLEVKERAAEGLQYGKVIANEGGIGHRSSRSSQGLVWYLLAFDLVNLLASVPSSRGTGADASGSGGSSTGDVRRSPKQTMHDFISAMVVK